MGASAVLHGVDALRNRYEAELRDYPDLMMECVRLFIDVESQAMAAENNPARGYEGPSYGGASRSLAAWTRSLEAKATRLRRSDHN